MINRENLLETIDLKAINKEIGKMYFDRLDTGEWRVFVQQPQHHWHFATAGTPTEALLKYFGEGPDLANPDDEIDNVV